ncbi:MAG: hypothetical protein VX371_00350, partial [Verrucomicrobiota bacterium]|nr:hypothetical protein [Verrucomicrobiota bacterium]
MLIGSITHQFVPVETRVPLKFGTETLTSVTCSRIRLEARGSSGSGVTGWGETPLSVQWVWPSALSYAERHEALMAFSESLVAAWTDWQREGDALELGHDLVFEDLPKRLDAYNAIERKGREPMPWLAALVCASPIDLALHDAFGQSLGRPTYACYDGESLAHDLSRYLEPAEDSKVRFAGRYPADYLLSDLPESLPVWHLVGGLDPLDSSELRGDEPDDGYPVHLREWIRRDGLSCLKIKLRGNDSEWDYRRLLEVGRISAEEGVDHLTTDFNCTVTEPAYVNDILDRLAREDSSTHDRILYVEQPFPYDLEMHRIPVHSLADRKPLFMDESAHDWKHVRLGRE